jgi:hypothetical protein
MHQCEDSSNSCPPCHQCVVIVPSGIYFSRLPPSSSAFSSLPLHRSMVGERRFFRSFPATDDDRPPGSSNSMFIPIRRILYFFKMNALRYAHRQGPAQTETDLRRKTKCPPMSPGAERFSDSHSRAIIIYLDRKHSFDAVQTRSVRRNEIHFNPPRDSAKARTQG